MTHYDQAKRSYKRREGLRGLLPYAIELVLLLVAAYLVWHFWTPISGFVGGLLHHGVPAEPPTGA